MPDTNRVRKIYGISNCDSCRKARKWLLENRIEYEFHDLREDGLEIQMLERWSGKLEWHKLLNTRSTTWRKLPERERGDMTKNKALAAMLQHPTLVKRPLLEDRDFICVGFSPQNYTTIFSKIGLV